jgi:hypothetical protein
MADLAQEELYHDSQLVEPVWKYEYDEKSPPTLAAARRSR